MCVGQGSSRRETGGSFLVILSVVIDLHCHLLPGIDDGAPDLAASLAMARAAVDGGVEAIVATPHVSGNFPNDPRTFAALCERVQSALDDAAVPLRVHTGAEIAVTRLESLDDEALGRCALGAGRYLLLEPPLHGPAPFLEPMTDYLERQGFRILLAHPERIPWFHADVARLQKLVDKGAVCSVTADSISGRFGGPVKKFTLELFRRGLVHNIASDAHDARRRSPALRPALEAAAAALPGLDQWLDWMTVEVPRAIVSGDPVAGEPPRIEPPGGLLRRFRRS
jgi:protein-tyrosine phosphatase